MFLFVRMDILSFEFNARIERSVLVRNSMILVASTIATRLNWNRNVVCHPLSVLIIIACGSCRSCSSTECCMYRSLSLVVDGDWTSDHWTHQWPSSISADRNQCCVYCPWWQSIVVDEYSILIFEQYQRGMAKFAFFPFCMCVDSVRYAFSFFCVAATSPLFTKMLMYSYSVWHANCEMVKRPVWATCMCGVWMWIGFYWQEKSKQWCASSAVNCSFNRLDNDAFDHHHHHHHHWLRNINSILCGRCTCAHDAVRRLTASSQQQQLQAKRKKNRNSRRFSPFRCSVVRGITSLSRYVRRTYVIDEMCVRVRAQFPTRQMDGKRSWRDDVMIAKSQVCHTRKHLILFICDRQLFIQISFDSISLSFSFHFSYFAVRIATVPMCTQCTEYTVQSVVHTMCFVQSQSAS